MWFSRLFLRISCLTVTTCILCFGLVAQSQSARFALVIGNGNYAELGHLANPANDATDMAAALKNLGFDTDLLVDADLDSMEGAVVRLGNKLGSISGSTGFFYYAGHGVQSGGINYLIPSDARSRANHFREPRRSRRRKSSTPCRTPKTALTSSCSTPVATIHSAGRVRGPVGSR